MSTKIIEICPDYDWKSESETRNTKLIDPVFENHKIREVFFKMATPPVNGSDWSFGRTPDAYIVVISYNSGPMPWAHQAVQQLKGKKLAVYLVAKVEVDEEEMKELVEFEVIELLEDAEFSEDVLFKDPAKLTEWAKKV